MTVTTTNNGIPLQGLGDSLNAWGIDSANGLNNALSLLEKLCSGVETVSLTGNVTLTTTAKADNQARNIGFILTDGGLSAAPTITVPSIEGVYLVYNAGSTYAVTLTCSGSATTASCGAGLMTVVLSDGTDCFAVTPRLDQISAPTSSVSMNSQKITSLATGTASTDAVNVSQMNTAIASAGVPASSGAVLISANDTTAKYLVDAIVAGEGLSETEDNDGADETLTLAVDINGTTAGTTTAAGDKVLIYDASAGALRAVTLANLFALMFGNVDMNGNTITLDAVTLSGTVSAADQLIQRPKFQDVSETVVTANSTTTYTCNLESGNVFKITLTGNCTFTFSNPPATGSYGAFRLELIQDGTGSRSATWPASVDWPSGSAPTLTSTATTGKDVLFFETTDGGTTWLGYASGQDFQ